MERAVDGDHITLSQHLLKVLHTPAANFFFHLGLEGLVVKVQEFLAVERLETAKHTFTDTTNSDGPDDLALEIIFVLGHGSNIPVSSFNHLVGRNKVADQSQDGHDDVLSHGDDVAASDFGDGDTAIGLVGSVQVHMVGADTRSDCDLELLGLCETLSSQIAGVETGRMASARLSRSIHLEVPSYGVVMMTSASTNSRSNWEFSPSLSEVVTNVCP